MAAAALADRQRLAGRCAAHGISTLGLRPGDGLRQLLACRVCWSSALISRWFPPRRLGVALAFAWSASVVGAIVIFPLALLMIAESGWRHAYLVFSLVSAAFIPLLLVLPWQRIERGVANVARRSARAAPMTLGSHGGRRSRARLAVLGAYVVIRSHLARHLLAGAAGHGLSARARPRRRLCRPRACRRRLPDAARHDRLQLAGRSRRPQDRRASLRMPAPSWALARWQWCAGPNDDVFVWLYVLLFGGSMGSRGPMISTLAALRYRGAHFGRIYGLISIGMGLGGFLGAWIGGLLHDFTTGRLHRGDASFGGCLSGACRRDAGLRSVRARATHTLAPLCFGRMTDALYRHIVFLKKP